jgi:integrase
VAADLTGATANRVLACVAKFFAWCEHRGWTDRDSNPTRGIRRFRTHARERWLRPDEMGRLLRAVAAEDGREDNTTVCDQLVAALERRGVATSDELVAAVGHPHHKAIQLLSHLAKNDPRVERVERGVYRHTGVATPHLGETDEAPYLRAFFWSAILTAARKGELLGLTWADVDFERRELTFRDRKDGRSLTLPMVPALAALLSALPRREDNPHVFAGRVAGKPLNNVSKAWDRICRRAQLEDAKVHDLRRSAASWLAQAGAPILVVRDALGHSTTAVTEQVYARLSKDPVRAALEDLERRVLAAVEDEPKTAELDNVRSLTVPS